VYLRLCEKEPVNAEAKKLRTRNERMDRSKEVEVGCSTARNEFNDRMGREATDALYSTCGLFTFVCWPEMTDSDTKMRDGRFSGSKRFYQSHGTEQLRGWQVSGETRRGGEK